MAESPLQATSVVTLSVEVDGKPIDDAIPIESVETFAELGGVSWAQVAVSDGDAAKGDFPISSSATFDPGSKIVISAGYAGVAAPVFEGVIVGHAIDFSPSDAARLWVECRRSGPPPMALLGAPAPLCVTYGLDILELHVETPSVEVLPGGGVAIPQPTRGPWVHGLVSFQGSPLATVGSLLEMRGLGDRFTGDVLVTSVTHRIESGDWTTEVGFGVGWAGDEEEGEIVPDPEARLELWRLVCSTGPSLGLDVDLSAISEAYELSAAGILRAVDGAGARAWAEGRSLLTAADILGSIRDELRNTDPPTP